MYIMKGNDTIEGIESITGIRDNRTASFQKHSFTAWSAHSWPASKISSLIDRTALAIL